MGAYFYSQEALYGKRMQTNQLNSSTIGHQREEYMQITPGEYIIEIVQPRTKEAEAKYGLGQMQNVNGVLRPVSSFICTVTSVTKTFEGIRVNIVGNDGFNNRMTGTYTYYQTPDRFNERPQYVQSLTRIN